MQVNGEQVTLETPVSVAIISKRTDSAPSVWPSNSMVRLSRAISVPDAMLDDQCVMEIVQFVQGG